MKYSMLLASLSLTLSLAACDTGNDELAQELETSSDTWQALASDAPAGYGYTRQFESFAGFGFITSFEVVSDQVTMRSYEAYDVDEFGDRVTTDTWTETGSELGSHEVGHPLLTIDQIYEQCRDDVLTRDPSENTLILSFHENGILRTCHYVPNDCLDDCSFGVDIASLELLGAL